MEMDAYLFDLGNVLARFDHWKFCHRLAAETKNLPAERINHIVFSNGLNKQFETGTLSGKEFYASLVAEFALCLPPLERFKEIWCDIFEENPGMVEMIQTLRTRSRIILLSNTNQWHLDFLRSRFSHLLDCFDAMILSHEVGVRKPDPEIFWYAVKAAKTDPPQCLYFDDVEEHVMAARRIGIHAVLFRYV
jgi:putative hydrolase of the HAD superfamily